MINDIVNVAGALSRRADCHAGVLFAFQRLMDDAVEEKPMEGAFRSFFQHFRHFARFKTLVILRG